MIKGCIDPKIHLSSYSWDSYSPYLTHLTSALRHIRPTSFTWGGTAVASHHSV